jgi:hypothetical protein
MATRAHKLANHLRSGLIALLLLLLESAQRVLEAAPLYFVLP